MRFLREIPIGRFTDKIYLELTNFGFVLVWKEESVEVWANLTSEGC